MKTISKRNGKALSMPAGLAYGAAVSVMLLLVLCGIIAKMILAEIIAETDVGYGVLFLLLVSSFLGSLTAYRKIKRQRMLVCFMSGILYLIILLSVTALFFGGQFEAVGVTSVLVLGGAFTASFVGIKEKRGGKRRKL